MSGIGIANVDERIKINYGNEYGLKVESRPGTGTKVFIRLPYLGEGNKRDVQGIAR
jgi:two-component system sensor histidine kinase YesM